LAQGNTTAPGSSQPCPGTSKPNSLAASLLFTTRRYASHMFFVSTTASMTPSCRRPELRAYRPSVLASLAPSRFKTSIILLRRELRSRWSFTAGRRYYNRCRLLAAHRVCLICGCCSTDQCFAIVSSAHWAPLRFLFAKDTLAVWIYGSPRRTRSGLRDSSPHLLAETPFRAYSKASTKGGGLEYINRSKPEVYRVNY